MIRKQGKYNKAKYIAYLNSPQWKRKRRQKAKEQDYFCEICGLKLKKGFHIHHKHYKTLKREAMTDLLFLCSDCHKIVHEQMKERERAEKTQKVEKKSIFDGILRKNLKKSIDK